MNQKLLERLIKHEGLRLKPYRCTAGKLTIGIGRNLEDVGITESEAIELLKNDLARCHHECLHSFWWYHELDETRQGVLLEMCFNLGLKKLKSFRHMLTALSLKDYGLAAREMRSSLWAQQVGQRAKTLADLMQRGA